MKKIFLYCAVLFVAMLTTTACSDDNDNFQIEFRSWESYGTVQAPTEDGFSIVRRDDGAELIIGSSTANDFEIEIGQRILMNYIIQDDVSGGNIFQKRYLIRLNAAVKIVTKKVINQTFIDADPTHREDSIGNNPIFMISKAWFADKFINIDLSIVKDAGLGVAHNISLVYDNISLDSLGNAVLTLRHNAYRDTIKVSGGRLAPATKVNWTDNFDFERLRVAFDISSILAKDQTSVNVVLKWVEYNDDLVRVEKTSNVAVFMLPQANRSKLTNNGENNILVDGTEFGLD